MPDSFNILDAEETDDPNGRIYQIPQDTLEVILLHGTSSNLIASILAKGIQPRKNTGKNCWGSWGPTLASKLDRSYFGDFLVSRRSAINACGKYGSTLAYVQATLDITHLVPDEDMVSQFGARNWRESLAHGSCATKEEAIDTLLNVWITGKDEYPIKTEEVTFIHY